MKHGNDLTKTERRRLCLFILHLAIVAGIITGAVLTASDEASDIPGRWWMHQFFAPIFSGNTVLDVFKNTFLSSEFFLLLTALLGFVSIGQPFVIALLVCRGIGIGSSVASMYVLFGTGSIAAAAVLIVPKAVILSFIAALSGREAIKLSNMQTAFLFRNENADDKMDHTVKLFFIKVLVLTIIIFLVSVLDSVFNYLFLDLY